MLGRLDEILSVSTKEVDLPVVQASKFERSSTHGDALARRYACRDENTVGRSPSYETARVEG